MLAFSGKYYALECINELCNKDHCGGCVKNICFLNFLGKCKMKPKCTRVHMSFSLLCLRYNTVILFRSGKYSNPMIPMQEFLELYEPQLIASYQ